VAAGYVGPTGAGALRLLPWEQRGAGPKPRIAPLRLGAPRRVQRVFQSPMDPSTPGTDVLSELRSGKRDSLDRLLPLVYQELRAMAHRQLVARGRGGTLQTTALVHEAYLKLVDQSRAEWRDRVHFLAVASLAMRHVLVDRAKARLALKRGGEFRRITLDEQEIGAEDQPDALVQLDEALDRLGEVGPRLVRVVECRFFGGLTEDEIAEALGLTVRTVQRDWAKARMLLRRALES
jgi:RNA polymerase sigma factor (TIGR02999 family)